MLNISLNSVNRHVNRDGFDSLRKVEERRSGRVLLRLLIIFSLLFLLSLFLPWTQHIRATGQLTALQPNQRPQRVQSVIGGQIVEWYVREGDLVAAGDTILRLTETKDQYFDTSLLDRTRSQVLAKEMSLQSYQSKVSALADQMEALRESGRLRTEQAENKLQQARLTVASDSMDLEATRLNTQVAREQYERMQALYDQGLKSLTDLENRRVTYQQAQAKLLSAENRLLASRNDVINARVELNAIQAKLRDDLAKASSERFTALSGRFDAEAGVAKLENEYSNYERRTELYILRAPQSGYITEILAAGIGENLSAGEEVVTIVPADYELAVEMFVRPIDLPLLNTGQQVNIQFEGWPSIVFSGWPNTSYGTYSGMVVAIDRTINATGRYRVMVAPDESDEEWPDALRVGSGATALVLLKDVPIWYELWRKINGFPPDLYAPTKSTAPAAPPKIKVPK
ncbi:multidrug efflux pump subunit AcrA (membrane-fusion protein) [Lewinella aquimaris]|uniref:Multidrug efflux pump subunit AcrA (Membrane-fusion protein) n=1 Tax=Neolewinella aquimaris TaxID=1835722 RepID=A0A840EBH0_9BACT|nr:HlyD family efflux transporter periplasmic adaptor subunit [Neolewinella aquimaris]MBB4081042.1 multidrug efflux pump subunit AcrA (membrane-fusion protein) [Neolewinella aquimaris]